MSWWIDENISYTKITDTETPYDERLANICADDFASLPEYNSQQSSADNPFILVRGSKAFVLSTSKKYMLNSQNQWVEIHESSGGGASSADQVSYDNTDSGLNATNVQDAIDELKDTDDTQDNALVELYGENANQQLEIDYAINTGAKNLINYDGLGYTSRDGVTRTTRGVTFTLNGDGTVSCSGTNDGTAVSRCRLFMGTSLLYIQDYCTGGYMISGCPANGSSTTYYLVAYANTTPSYSVPDYGSGVILTEQSVSGNVFIEMVIGTGVDSTGVVFKPMVRDRYIKSTTYQPYAPTNRELYETKANKGSFDLTIAGSPLVASEYSYSCIVTGDIATVCIRLVLADELAINTSRNLFKIPTGYRPPQAVAGTGYADSKLRVFWINTSGDVKIRIDEAIPSGASINANFCYSYNSANWTTVTANQVQSLNSPLTLNLDRNDLNESLDSNFDLIDSIPEEEEGELE